MIKDPSYNVNLGIEGSRGWLWAYAAMGCRCATFRRVALAFVPCISSHCSPPFVLSDYSHDAMKAHIVRILISE